MSAGPADRPAIPADLYGEMILDHSRRPRHFGRLEAANRTAQGDNPLCGDRVSLFVEVAGDRVCAISFEGAGCAISTASASLMSEAVSGKTLEEVRDLARSFQHLVTTGSPGEDSGETLGKLVALGGVSRFPMRVKCATLAWHALESALANPVAAAATTAKPTSAPSTGADSAAGKPDPWPNS